MNNNKEAQPHIEALLNMITPSTQKSWMERTIEMMMMLGIHPTETLELRLSGSEDYSPRKLVQSAINIWLSSFQIYPTQVAAHSAIAALFEADETYLKAAVKSPGLQHYLTRLYGPDFTPPPIHIVADDSLDPRTIAIRLKLDTNNEEYQEALLHVLQSILFKDMER